MYPNNNNNRKKKGIKIIKGRTMREEGTDRRDREFNFFFSLRFFLRSMKIESQVFVGAEGKIDLRV